MHEGRYLCVDRSKILGSIFSCVGRCSRIGPVRATGDLWIAEERATDAGLAGSKPWSICYRFNEVLQLPGQRAREIAGRAARRNRPYMITDPTTRGDVGQDVRVRWLAAMAVLCVAITWGVSFTVVKATIGKVSPSRLVGWRFTVATFALLTLRPRVLRELDRRTVGRGTVMGALLGIGFVLCTVGMQTTSVLISAFVVGTTVVFAPLIGWVWLRRRFTIRAAAAVLLALLGLAMITVRSFAVGPGTLLILIAAVLWAVHLVALER